MSAHRLSPAGLRATFPPPRLRGSVARHGGLVLGADVAADRRGAGGTDGAVLAHAGQPDAGHVAVDRLVLARAHPVGLVPDADVAGAPHELVEPAPRGQVLG